FHDGRFCESRPSQPNDLRPRGTSGTIDYCLIIPHSFILNCGPVLYDVSPSEVERYHLIAHENSMRILGSQQILHTWTKLATSPSARLTSSRRSGSSRRHSMSQVQEKRGPGSRWPIRSRSFWCGLIAGAGLGLGLGAALVELELLTTHRKAWVSVLS